MSKRIEAINATTQGGMTPDTVLASLKAGNERFLAGTPNGADQKALISQTSGGQWPQAAVVSCIDSRVPVETVMDQYIGDIFVARVAGNFVNPDIVGSLEYACKVAGSKLIVVLGHEGCGAVKAACDHVELGNITQMLAKITPAVDAVSYDGERSSASTDFVNQVIDKNVEMTIDELRRTSPILGEMEKNGEIKIVGAVYKTSSGEIIYM
ncbi:MAG: carbonic anhydrase family protein [Flavobacteriaceae bacterium]